MPVDGLAVFASDDDVDDVTISPSGTYLAVKSSKGGASAVSFLETATLKMLGGHRLTGLEVILSATWANDERVVLALGERSGPLAPPTYYGDLVAIDVNGRNLRTIFGFRSGESTTGTRIRKKQSLKAWGYLLDPLPHDADHVLIRSVPWGREYMDRTTSIYKVNVKTGMDKRIHVGPGHALYYVTDEDGQVRAAMSAKEGGRLRPFVLDQEGAWQPLAEATSFSNAAEPYGYSAARGELYVVDDADGKPGSLLAVSAGDGSPKVLSSSPQVSPSHIVLSPDTGMPVAVRYEPDYSEWKVLDAKDRFGSVMQHLARTFEGRRVDLRSRTQDGAKLIVLVSSDVDPGVFYLVETETMAMTPLLRRNESIDVAKMRPTEAFKIKVRDGQVIHGYLTLPSDDLTEPPPLVVRPHGGPHGIRTVWGFNPRVQMLASQGIAVLEVNFRGSGGYGRAFEKAGYAEWGAAIQDDIIDAVRWAIREKVADPERICAYGGSFGGYSAVQLAIRAPDLIRCSVGVAGVYDIPGLAEASDMGESRWTRDVLARYVGDDLEAQRAASPVYHPDKIQAPVLLIHGEDDKRAPIAQAKALCSALEGVGKPCETLFIPKEGHGFRDAGNRLQAYRRTVDFLRKHLGLSARKL